MQHCGSCPLSYSSRLLLNVHILTMHQDNFCKTRHEHRYVMESLNGLEAVILAVEKRLCYVAMERKCDLKEQIIAGGKVVVPSSFAVDI